MSRAQEIQQSDPQDPDLVARLAGKNIYGSVVGALRRVELYRLGNAWGMNFPVGASKDFMLPFFKQLEAEGKNPMRPPGTNIEHTAQLRTRDAQFSEDNHAERSELEAGIEEASSDVIAPAPMSDFEIRLRNIPHYQLKKICKLRGIQQDQRDRKEDLIARILAVSGGTLEYENTP